MGFGSSKASMPKIKNKKLSGRSRTTLLNVKKLDRYGIHDSTSTLLGIALAGIMGIGGYFIMLGDLTYGEFVSFTLFLAMIAPIVQMSNISSQLTELCWVGPHTRIDVHPRRRSSSAYPAFEKTTWNWFENVSCYETNKAVLHEVSFEAAKEVWSLWWVLLARENRPSSSFWLFPNQLAELFLSMNKTFQK